MGQASRFCPLPWLHLCANPTGRLMLCCEDTLESDFPGRRAYSLADNEWQSYWHSPYLNWVRQKMQAGESLRECAVCAREEALGLTSKGQYESQKWGPVQGGPVVRYADLKLGHDCNLQCFMCDPNSSSRIASEFRALGWDIRPPFAVGQMGIPVVDVYKADFGWPNRSEVWSLLDDRLSELQRIKFTGGEPLLNPHLADYLSQARRRGRRDLEIQVTTNATHVPSRVIELLRDFETDVVVSLEGVAGVNDFVRYPSRWEEIVANIERLKAAGLNVRINATCSIFNVLHLPELIEFSHGRLEERLTLIPVFRPEIFAPCIAPDSLKTRVQEKLLAWIAQTNVPTPSYYAEQISRRVWAEAGNPVLFARLKHYTETLCAHRGLDIRRYLPELAEAFAMQS